MATDAFFGVPNSLICYAVSLPKGVFAGLRADLAEYKSQQGEEATRTFIAYVSGCADAGAGGGDGAGDAGCAPVIYITAPGFTDTPDKFALTSALLRITFPIFC